MIDLHAHILPGVDDGPDTLEQALAMLRMAADDGIRTVVATSHFRWEDRTLTIPQILEMAEAVRREARDAEIPIEVVPGAEVMMDEDTFFAAARGSLMTYANNGKYLLLEFPAHQVPAYADPIIEQLLANGFVPLIAHPERNDELRRYPRRLQQWLSMGVLTQVTGYSVIGRFGPECQKTARRMLAEGLISIIASDGHSPHRRPVVLSEAVSATEKLIGSEKTLEMVTDLPKIILEGGIVRAPAGPICQKKSFWQRLFGSGK